MKHYEAAFFDLDGTLFDTSEGILASLNHTIKEMSLPEIDLKERASFIGPSLRDSIRRVFRLPENEENMFISIFRKDYEENKIYCASEYQGMRNILNCLRSMGIKTAVATNKPQTQAVKIVDFFGYTPLFNAIFGADETGKLDKGDIILLGLKTMQISGRSLLVGDTINDAMAAKKSGLDFVGVLYGFGFHDKKEAQKHGAIFAANSPDLLLEYIMNTIKMEDKSHG